MITCDVCRTLNDDNARSCTWCGTSLWLSGRQPSGDISSARPVAERQQPAYTPPSASAYTPPAIVQPQPMRQPQTTGWRCPYCKTSLPPFVIQKISDAGWIVFALMLLMCLPLFWIGLLMKDDQRFCSACRARLS